MSWEGPWCRGLTDSSVGLVLKLWTSASRRHLIPRHLPVISGKPYFLKYLQTAKKKVPLPLPFTTARWNHKVFSLFFRPLTVLPEVKRSGLVGSNTAWIIGALLIKHQFLWKVCVYSKVCKCTIARTVILFTFFRKRWKSNKKTPLFL